MKHSFLFLNALKLLVFLASECVSEHIHRCHLHIVLSQIIYRKMNVTQLLLMETRKKNGHKINVAPPEQHGDTKTIL